VEVGLFFPPFFRQQILSTHDIYLLHFRITGMSTAASVRQIHPKGFPQNGAHIEHHENVERTETLSPLTDGYAHDGQRKTHNHTGSVC
jgi:hypothetical protein